MVLSLLSMRMEAGTAIVAMLGVEVEEEDVVFVAADVEDTMDLRLIGSKMEATIMKPLPKVAVEDTMDLILIGSKMEATIMKPLPKVAAVGFLLFYLFLQSFNTSNSFPYGMWCMYLYVFTYNVGLVFSQHVAI